MTNTSVRTRAAALAFLGEVAKHFLNTNTQMPEAVCDAGIELLDAVSADEAEAMKMRGVVAEMVDELDDEKPARFNLRKDPIDKLHS